MDLYPLYMGIMNLRGIIDTLFGGGSTSAARTNLPSNLQFLTYDTSMETAMKVSAVFRATALISAGVARLALTLQRYNSARKCFVDYYSSPLYSALRVRPNESLTAYEMWRAAVQQMLLQGNAYILPNKAVDDEVESLTLLSPNSVQYDATTREYTINDGVNKINKVVKAKDIIHLKNIGVDAGRTGLSTIQFAGQAMGILRLADSNTAKTLTNGGRIRGILTGSAPMPTMGDASTRQLRDVADMVEADIADDRSLAVVPGDMKFQPMTLSPADAKVLESKQFTIRDIARYFGVHPDLLYEGSNNTYKAAEVPNVMFLSQTLEPLLVQIENELLVKLVPESMWGKRRIRFDREALYTTDLSTESIYYEKMLQTGIYTVNELRVKKGQAPVLGGDVALVSANLKGLGEIVGNTKVDNE